MAASVGHTIQVPKASIGQWGKSLKNLQLVFDEEDLRLMSCEDKTNIVQPFKWKNITGLDLRYSPLSLHQLVIEVETTRIRDTTKKEFTDRFLVLHFHTKDIALVEEQIEKRKMNPLVKEGISQLMVYPPFCRAYSVQLRKAINFLGKVTRVFTTICLLYTVLSWFVKCPKGTKEEDCTTLMLTIINFLTHVYEFGAAIVAPYLATVLDLLNSIPLLKYVLMGVGSLILFPFWAWFLGMGIIIYFSEMAIQLHLLVHLFDVLSTVVTNYKMVNSIVKYIISFVSVGWKGGSGLYGKLKPGAGPKKQEPKEKVQ